LEVVEKEIERSAGLSNKKFYGAMLVDGNVNKSYQSFHLVLDDHVRVLWLAN